MRNSWKNVQVTIWAFGAALVMLGAFCGEEIFAAEKKARKGSNKPIAVLSRQSSAYGDVAGHEIYQSVILSKNVVSSDKALEGFEQTMIEQGEEIAGSGTHRGFETDKFKDGLQFVRYEGTHKTITKEGGAWELTTQGKYTITGGTGPYAKAKGEGTYKCRFTAEGGQCDWEEISEW